MCSSDQWPQIRVDACARSGPQSQYGIVRDQRCDEAQRTAYPIEGRALIATPVVAMNQRPADAPLTPREMQVLKLVAKGESSKKIGHELGISIKTVEFHRSNAVRKLRLGNRADIVSEICGLSWQICK